MPLSDGHHDDIRRDADLVQGGLVGTGRPALSTSPDDLGLDPQSLGGAVLIGLDAGRERPGSSARPLGEGSGDSSGRGRHVRLAAAVDAGDLVGPQADGLRVTSMATLPPPMTTTCLPVKSGITSSPMALSISTADKTFLLSSPGMPVFFVLMGADGDVDAVELLFQLLQPDITANGDVGMYLNAQGQNGFDLGVQLLRGSGSWGCRSAAYRPACCLLVHRDLVTHKGPGSRRN